MHSQIQHAAQLIASIGQSHFLDDLTRTIQKVVSIDGAIALAGEYQARPEVIYDGLLAHDRDVFYDVYMKGAYLLSPYFRQLQQGLSPGLYRLLDIAPDDFVHSQYYQKYYFAASVVDELLLLFRPVDQIGIWISIYRSEGSVSFTEEERQRLALLEPILRQCVLRHYSEHDVMLDDAQESRDNYQHVVRVQQHFASDVLTQREQQIMQLMLQGHSSKSAAKALDISPETERVHRKNIYAKLSVTSQVELLVMFLEALASTAYPPRPQR